MKTRTRLLIVGVATAFAAGSGASTAQDTRTALGDTSLNSSVTTAADQHVGKANKASGLIGMDVRNSQNEKLGEIKDLVLDLNTGKISYAVLSVGGFLGIGDKYVAVPPGAFHTGPDQNTLVLNADKAKIQNAPGFAKSSWPEVNSSTWATDSTYWLSDTAQGTIGSTRSGTDTLRSEPPTSIQNPAQSSSTALKQDVSRSLPGQSTLDRETFKGRITALNPTTRTFTVEGPAGSREFKLAEQPTLTLKENRNPSLIDFKVGYPVTVGYHEENGTYMAHTLIRSDAPEAK